jgi:hypothetical protein
MSFLVPYTLWLGGFCLPLLSWMRWYFAKEAKGQ